MDPVIRLRAETGPRGREHAEEFEPGECYTESLVETFLAAYTKPGDLVFDPFAGSGTTLVVAERMGRRALGLELHAERVDYVKSRLAAPAAIRQADALRLGELDLPPIDFSITSPPYMTRTGHPENPLTGYQTTDGDYPRYLGEITEVYRQLRPLLRTDARVVLNVANLRHDEDSTLVTPLAWDIAGAVSEVLRFEREIVIDWDVPLPWFTNDYCLVFRPE
ncbi:TRM11 family SAM-dependent methyltransferase [Flindersiella endophytica]